MFNTVIYQGNSVFQGKRRLLKTPEYQKIYIRYSKFKEPSVFHGKRKLLKNSECEKYIPYSEKFQDNSVFSGQARVT